MGKSKKNKNADAKKEEQKNEEEPSTPAEDTPAEATPTPSPAPEVEVEAPPPPSEEPEAGPSSPRPAPAIASPPLLSESLVLPAPVEAPARPSLDSTREDADAIAHLEAELAVVRNEKEVLSGQYRGLLGKLTAMRQSLGDKLREDAEELDRRESSINSLTTQVDNLQQNVSTLQAELESASSESASLAGQLAQIRSQSDSSSSDVLSLTREMRELRGEMERLRIEREEWEGEASRERARREAMEEEVRQMERRERDARREAERSRDEAEGERTRGNNLQEVLAEFQAAKESELHHATSDLEKQLHAAVSSLSEFKLRCANAETRVGEMSGDAGRSTRLEKEIREKERLISKLRHDAVVNNEHLTEALRRLRKNSSSENVDRRLVTNILLSFLSASRGDTKRFEMLNILSTILTWDDTDREKAGLQRIGGKAERPKVGRKGSGRAERSAEEEAAMNESFSNLFVEFLLKEASQGQPRRPDPSSGNPASPTTSSPNRQPELSLSAFSPPPTGTSTPFARDRAYSSTSSVSGLVSPPIQGNGDRPVMGLPTGGRKQSYNLTSALNGER